MKLSPKVWVPLAILAAGLLVVTVLALTRPQVVPSSPEAARPLVRVLRVAPEDVTFAVHTQGTVVPRTESELVPQVAGEVVWVSPDLAAGGFFEKDEPLVKIDPVDYETDLETARALLARAESESARARKELARQRRLAERAVASQSRIDDVENAQRVAEAALRQARAQAGRAQRDLERTVLRAPFQGRVRQENVDVGQFVSRGSPVATLYAVDYAEVRLPLPDRELLFVDLPLVPPNDSARGDQAPGPEVVLRATFAGAPRTWRGRIVRTEGEIDPRSRMVNVVARIEDPYGTRAEGTATPLAVGLFVDAEILGRKAEGVFVLPREALHHDATTGEDVVYVVDEAGRLRFRPVAVLRAERNQVMVGEGLAAGERVVVSPLAAAVDDMAVRVAESPAPPAEDGLARRAP